MAAEAASSGASSLAGTAPQRQASAEVPSRQPAQVVTLILILGLPNVGVCPAETIQRTTCLVGLPN